MKVTIDIRSNELLHVKARLLVRDNLVKSGFSERTVEDEILRRIYEAAQDSSEKKEKED